MDELAAVIDSHEWTSGGGGGFGGGGMLVLLPGESLVGWVRVSLFTAESLREMRDQPVTHLRLQAMYHQVVSHYPVATLRIRGNISKRPREVDVVSKLYVPYREHPDSPAWWDDAKNWIPTFVNSEGMSQIPWMYNTPEGLRELRGQLDPESAMYRAVRILQAQQVCSAAQPEEKKPMEGLLKELEHCGPAEREWYRRGEIQRAFRHARDFESAKLFAEQYPETLRSTERYTADGRLEPITADEARFGRRPGVSTPER